MFTEILIGLLVVLIVWDFLHKQRRHRMLNEAGVQGPIPLPLLGNALELVGMNPINVFDAARKLHQKHGKVYRLWLATECAVIVHDAKYLEAILSSQQLLAKSDMYNMLKTWFGDSLLMTRGPKWFRRRKIITPTFHFKILQQFTQVFDQQSRLMIKGLAAKADGVTIVDIGPAICRMALDVIVETAMGVRINAQEQPEFESYSKALTYVSDIFTKRAVSPLDRFDWIFRTFSNKTHRRVIESIDIMHKLTDEVIKERRDALQRSIEMGTYDYQQEIDNENNELGLKRRHTAFLDVLLQSTIEGKPSSDQDIREEVETFMFEGHDTTTSGICYTLYLLSRHSEIQTKVFQEIEAMLDGDRNKPVSMQDLQQLKYLECVIKESLRLYPPVPVIGRRTTHDCIINGKTFPANCNFYIFIFEACRDSDYFPQADQFLPERFLDATDQEKINPFAYVPFSAGPRNCIGQKFAMLEMKCAISKILANYVLLPLGVDVRPALNITLKSITGFNMGLKRRVD